MEIECSMRMRERGVHLQFALYESSSFRVAS